MASQLQLLNLELLLVDFLTLKPLEASLLQLVVLLRAFKLVQRPGMDLAWEGQAPVGQAHDDAVKRIGRSVFS